MHGACMLSPLDLRPFLTADYQPGGPHCGAAHQVAGGPGVCAGGGPGGGLPEGKRGHLQAPNDAGARRAARQRPCAGARILCTSVEHSCDMVLAMLRCMEDCTAHNSHTWAPKAAAQKLLAAAAMHRCHEMLRHAGICDIAPVFTFSMLHIIDCDEGIRCRQRLERVRLRQTRRRAPLATDVPDLISDQSSRHGELRTKHLASLVCRRMSCMMIVDTKLGGASCSNSPAS